MRLPPGYRFLQVVLVIGAIGFAVIGLFYLAGGQTVPGLFALFLAVIEALALPLFKRLLAASRPPDEADH
jgi:hypothetical protein